MNGNKYFLIILIILLLIWNGILTFIVIDSFDNSKTIVNEQTVSGFSTDFTNIINKTKSSVVSIETLTSNQTGFIYKVDDNIAYVVSTYHGIENNNIIRLTLANDSSFEGTLVGYDPFLDVSVISFETPYELNTIKVGNNELLKDGEFVINIGTSNNSQFITNTKLGMVSNRFICIKNDIKYENINYSYYLDAICLSSDVKEGYSGSPIINMNGETIGMITMSNNENVYGNTINELKIVADNIINEIENEKINLGICGEYIGNLELYEKNSLNLYFDITSGYYVSNVMLDSIGNRIGILAGDVIDSINDNKIVSQTDMLKVLYSNTNDLSINVYRNGELISLKGSLHD